MASARARCQNAFADRENAAFALDRFDHERADRVVEFGFEIRDVIHRTNSTPGNERRKRFAVFGRVRDRKSAEGAAVKRIFERQDASLFRARILRLRVRIGAAELQRAINGFGTAIGKEDAVQAGPFG